MNLTKLTNLGFPRRQEEPEARVPGVGEALDQEGEEQEGGLTPQAEELKID